MFHWNRQFMYQPSLTAWELSFKFLLPDARYFLTKRLSAPRVWGSSSSQSNTTRSLLGPHCFGWSLCCQIHACRQQKIPSLARYVQAQDSLKISSQQQSATIWQCNGRHPQWSIQNDTTCNFQENQKQPKQSWSRRLSKWWRRQRWSWMRQTWKEEGHRPRAHRLCSKK